MPQGKLITLYPEILNTFSLKTVRFKLSELSWPMEQRVPSDVKL